MCSPGSTRCQSHTPRANSHNIPHRVIASQLAIIVIGEAKPKDLMHQGSVSEPWEREILRLWLRMTCRGCGGCFIAMTVTEAGALGRGCKSDLQLPGGGKPPPYGCVAGGGCVETEALSKPVP